MSSFAAPNMTAIGTMGGTAAWDVGQPAVSFAQGQPFSIEAWIFVGPGALNGAVVTKPNEFYLGVMGGVLCGGWFGQGSLLTGATVLAPNAWHFVAATYDGATLTLYLDGAPDSSMSYAGPGNPSSGQDFVIGATTQNDAFSVWSVTLYNACRTAAQEEAAPWVDLAPDAALQAHYDFSVAPPVETVNALPIAPLGGAVSMTFAPAFRFDGRYAGLFVTGPSSLTVGPQFTVSAWMAWSGATGTVQTILSTGDVNTTAGAFSLVLDTVNPGLNLLVIQRATFGSALPININPGDWHNVAATYDGSILTLYLDGEELGAIGGAGPLGNSTSPQWTVGFAIVSRNKTNWFSGDLQWLSLWNRCLSPDEIAYQQYGSVSTDSAIQLDLPLDSFPATSLTDLAQNLTAQNGGTVAAVMQQATVTAWSPPPQQVNPPVDAVCTGTPQRLERADWPTPAAAAPRLPVPSITVEAALASASPDLEAALAGLPRDVADGLRARFREATARAMSTASPPPASWRRDGLDQVFLFDHPTDGPQELLRVRAAGLTNCQSWWLSFMFTLIFGVMNLFSVAVRGQDLSTWIQRRILNNQTAMEALAAAWSAQPGFTGFTVLKLLAAIYNLGLMRNLIWFVAYQLGYIGALRLFGALAARAMFPGGAAVVFAASAAILAAQLSVMVVGAPGQPGYNQSCGSGSDGAPSCG